MPVCPNCSGSFEATRELCPYCGVPSQSKPRDSWIGKTLAGGYVIREHIGSGAMANVYRAEQTKLGRSVAVKIMHGHLLHDETTGRRFITEARAASRLNHPHSLAVIDFGRMDSGQPYMVMEYLRGPDLQRLLDADGPLPFRRVLHILLQLLDALSEAHRLDIIHRDLKPENIVVEPVRSGGDFVKVVDFGLAKILSGPEDVSITATGTVCGTPDFMSPEQCRGDKLDARSDLYAVGVILFVLLAGRVPFVADTPTQALLKHLTAPPPDPREVAPERCISERLAKIVVKSLAKDPAARFQSADGFADALTEAQNELAGAVSPVPLPPGTTTIRCPACGGWAPAGTKYCVECGEPIAASLRQPPSGASPAPPIASQRPHDAAHALLPLVGRDADLVALLDTLQLRTSGLRAARIRGEAGAGKSRLISEFATRALKRGHVVVATGPDPWHAGVTYFALRQTVQRLAVAQDGDPLAALPASVDPAVRWGLGEIFGRAGHESTPDDRKGALLRTLVWAIEQAQAGAPDSMVVLIIDDLDRIDGPSRVTFNALVRAQVANAVFVVAAHVPTFDAGWPEASRIRDIGPLTPDQAALLIEQVGMRDSMLEGPHEAVTPLYLEQALRFADEGTGAPPPTTGDLIAQRLTRLDMEERRVLQALSVLGDGTTLSTIARLLDAPDGVERGATQLLQRGLIRRSAVGFDVGHALIREVVLGLVPAAVSRSLYQRALNLSPASEVPLRARARFALGAEDAFEALVLVDQAGAAALARGDTSGAIDMFRQGLDFARMDLQRGNLDDPMNAVVMFGRKLGEALTLAGTPIDAEGVLQEALNYADPDSTERARVLLALAVVSHQRDRKQEAFERAQRAAKAARRAGDDQLVATISKAARAWQLA